MADTSRTDRAAAQFRKLQRAEDGKKAMSEYEASQAAIRAKTARLRELRLAHEAANPPPVAAPKPVRKKAAQKTAGEKPTATLSSWLQDQKKNGYRT